MVPPRIDGVQWRALLTSHARSTGPRDGSDVRGR